MSEEQLKLTPVAGRATINKKEAITGSVSLAILINIFVLVLVQGANMLFLHTLPALFWVIAGLFIAADGVLCVLIFRRALQDAWQAADAAPYTIAFRSDGFLVLCHMDGRSEAIPIQEIICAKARPDKLGFIVNGWAYSGNLNYGSIVFFVKSGNKILKKRVKYVVNCAQAARYISGVFLSDGLDDAADC